MLANKGPGVIIKSAGIAVDYWSGNRNIKDIEYFFLTHVHTDHMKNLSSKWNKTIHCSQSTKDLLIDLVKINVNYLKVLELDKKSEFVKDGKSLFQVTLLDANHCPGSVMFLFEGNFGTILVTGDFRYNPLMFVDSPLSDTKIDKCFFDNTYLNSKFNNIPSQLNATNALLRLINVKKLQGYTAFGIKMNKIGKESLLTDLSIGLVTKIAISKKRFIRYTKVLNIKPNYFSLDFNNDCLLFVLNDENEFIDDLRGHKKYYINPSALNMDMKNFSLNAYINNLIAQKTNSVQVPYSEHSSYNELIEFAKRLLAREFIPINDYDECLNTDKLDSYIIPKEKKEKREFSCVDCNRWWWDRESTSRCKMCKSWYEPIPIEEEFGVCFFKCDDCNNSFNGYASRKISSVCYTCNKRLYPIEVKENKTIKRKTKFIHSCAKCLNNNGKRVCPIYGRALYASKQVK